MTRGGAMHRTCHVRGLCCRSLQAAALPSGTLLRCDRAAGASKLAGTRHIAGSKKVHTGRSQGNEHGSALGCVITFDGITQKM